MTQFDWQLQTPIHAIVFDCDGTLSTIEGIDELAKVNGVRDVVHAMTSEAMGKTGLNPDLYQKRLELVYPSQKQITDLGHQYYTHRVPDIDAVIQVLKRLDKKVYLVSAGLYPAVSIFGEALQIPRENIYAVDIQFDPDGNYLDYEKTSPLINNHGKRFIVNELKTQHADIMHVGDGLNDYVTYDLVKRFVGYGGAFYRENIAALCQYYISTLSMAPLLPLTLTPDEYDFLMPDEKNIYQKGLVAIQTGKVLRELKS